MENYKAIIEGYYEQQGKQTSFKGEGVLTPFIKLGEEENRYYKFKAKGAEELIGLTKCTFDLVMIIGCNGNFTGIKQYTHINGKPISIFDGFFTVKIIGNIEENEGGDEEKSQLEFFIRQEVNKYIGKWEIEKPAVQPYADMVDFILPNATFEKMEGSINFTITSVLQTSTNTI